MTTYTICNKATVRVAQALADALGVPLVPYDQFYLSMQGRYAKTQREQVEALLYLVNKGLASRPEVLEGAKYSDGGAIFKVHPEVTDMATIGIQNKYPVATIPAQKEDIMNAERTVQRLIDNDIFTGCNELVQRLSTDLNYDSASLVECEPQLFFKEDRSELPTGLTIKQEMLADNYIVLDEDGDEVAFDADEATAISESWGSANEEPPMVESLQYWIVSDWLANKLEDVGALVAHDVLGFSIWGRSECGQCLTMDSDLNAVAKLLERI